MNKTLYKVQVYDTDIEKWEDDDSYSPASKFDAEDDARAVKRRCAYPLKVRVVKAE